MAWPKQMTADEILGMSTDDLKNKLEGAATKDDLTSATTKIDELGTSLAAIQASLAKLTTPVALPDPNHDADLNDPTTQMLTDPAGYVARQTQGLANQAAETKAQLLEMRARAKYPAAFSKYDADLVAGAARFSVQQRAQDTFWDFHVRTFMGDKYISGETQGSYPSLMGSGSGVANISGPDDPNKGFDPEVAAFLKERGVPLDKAARIKKSMIDDGEPVDINTYRKAS